MTHSHEVHNDAFFNDRTHRWWSYNTSKKLLLPRGIAAIVTHT
jgi:hypothetical protein